MTPDEAFKARAGGDRPTIEKESLDKDRPAQRRGHALPGRHYHLYRYKKYTDVRLVFAPEQQIAFFGGDPDNFEYPRYDLDFCFFRVYEDDKPAKIEHYLKWSKNGVRTTSWSSSPAIPAAPNRLDTDRRAGVSARPRLSRPARSGSIAWK